MAKASAADGIQVNEDLAFERKSWIVQRLAWVVMTLILIAALLGAFGRGLLSAATVSNESMTLKYDRFVRNQAPAELRVTLLPFTVPERGDGGEATIWIAKNYLQKTKIDVITPEPTESHATEHYLLFTFSVPDRRHATDIVFRLEIEDMGCLNGEIGLGELGLGEPSADRTEPIRKLAFSQFAYP